MKGPQTTGVLLAMATSLTFGVAAMQGCERQGGKAQTTAHEEAEKGHDAGGEARPTAQPQSYAEAVGVIHEQIERIDGLIKSKKLDKVHAEAAVIRDVAGTLGALALKPGSGVPSAAVKEINVAAKDLAAKFGPIDEAGDSGDAAATKKIYDEMVALHGKLQKYAAADAAHGPGK